jgi:hypothetical protein|tara:strand:+ start:265 stop:1035 length:771 start_codon:yes stop_codon:yes gene_type:complete
MKTKKQTPSVESNWEIKDRTYLVAGRYQPLTLRIPSKHTNKVAMLYFDPETNEQRELRYATNMSSPFKDEQEGEATLGHIMFRDGSLFVPKQNQQLQKLLSLYHPLKGRRYNEFDAIIIANDELDVMELQIDALNAARALEVDQAEAILRVEFGSKVTDMSSKELKRDLLIFARNQPKLFLELAKDDNVQLRNFAIKACEAKIIKLAADQRSFSWASNGKKLMTVPFDENPYSAMASFFKTDEGVEIFKSVEKKLK